jgi:TolB-like protein/DNA-binding SARP family transcriptional activator
VLIRLFGDLDLLSSAGEPIHPPTRKAWLLLAALAVLGEKGARREKLCELFWPGRGEAQARGSLRQALAAIRQVAAEMGEGFPRVDGVAETVRLVADPSKVDVQLFERLIRRQDVENLAAAAELYQGDLLASIVLPEPLDQWFTPYQRALRNKALMLCEQLSQLVSKEQGVAAKACERLAERLLAADPAAEEAHRALIRLYQSQGRTNAALQQFELCKEALHRHLGVEPEAQTRELIASQSQTRQTAPHLPPPDSAQPVSAPRRDKDQPSIVVMPFDNLSGEGDEYFVDGVVEEITAALSRVRDFFVIARQSAFTYKGRFIDVREVGRELGVTYVVEGTVRRGGDRLRISVQLVDSETRTQLWSERYEGATKDIFEFQDKIAAQVAGAIRPAIRSAEIEMAKRKPPASLRAYDLVMRAYPNLWGHDEDANKQAIPLLEEAISIDPAYGRALALLAWCHALNAVYLWTEEPEYELDSALKAVQAAAGSINDDPTALTAAGGATSICGDQERATAFIERALALDPNNAWAWARFGWVAIHKGEPNRATERFERALKLSPADPFSFNMRMGIAQSLAMTGSLSEAIAIAREVMSKHPEVTWSYRMLASWSAMSGDLETARWAAQKLLAARPDFTIERVRALPVFKNVPQWADQMAEALRLAGLPER